MARFSIGEDDEEAPSHKRPRFCQPASQSQPQPQRSVQRSQSRPVVEEEDDEEFVPVDDFESDSQVSEEEEDEEDFEFAATEEEDIGEGIGSEDDDDDDEATEAVAEGQNPHQQMTGFTVASSQLGRGNVAGGLRGSSAVDPVFNNASGAIQVVLTDPDVLDCPICLDPLCSPVFQCENGHIACSKCCPKIQRKCPSCSMPIGYSRCRAIEKVLESIKIPCKNTPFGCKQTSTYNQITDHEQTCPYTTCACPNPSCPFTAPSKSLYLHFGIQHAASTTRFTYNTPFTLRLQPSHKHMFLQEQHESVIFILNHQIQQNGRAVNLDCLGPTTLKTAFVYRITAKLMDTSLSLESVPEVCTRWAERALKKNYLTVPADFAVHYGIVTLQICIKKAALG